MNIKVVIGVIINSEQQVLITQRALTAEHPGDWEFPGGKVEVDEDNFLALQREVKEEVDLDFNDAQFIESIKHDYGHKQVELLFYLIQDFNGYARCCESQQNLKWLPIDELQHYRFPEANKPFIARLQKKFIVKDPIV